MTVLTEIADWLKEQPAWMSHAAKRVFEKGTLDNGDIQDLVALVKAASGIPDAQGRIPVPLTPADVPAPSPATAVYLTSITDPKNVNAINHPDGITFESAGLTVVYGYNGAGKSGYARLLKRACRARNKEEVLSNVFSPDPAAQKPQAQFHWVANNIPGDSLWKDDVAAPDILSAIAVFDSHCARVFVDAQSEVSFVPYGLDILREVAIGLKKVEGTISTEVIGAKSDLSVFSHLVTDTEVGKAIRSLGQTSKPDEFRNLAKLSAEERERHATLAKLLTDDPVIQAQRLRRAKTRLTAMSVELQGISQPLEDDEIDSFRNALASYVATEKASHLASEQLNEGGTAIKGTGSEPWQELLRSAMRFAAIQHPDAPLLMSTSDERCILCQQPLDEHAKSRLDQFAKFLSEDTQTLAASRREAALEMFQKLKALQLEQFPADKPLLEELADLDKPLLETLVSYKVSLIDRRATVLLMAKEKLIGNLEPLSKSPSEFFTAQINALEKTASEFDSAIAPQVRAQRTREYAELNARLQLEPLLENVLTSIERMKYEAALKLAERACNTTAVTRKNGELFEKAVSADLRIALAKELEAMGMSDLKISLDTQGQKGARLQQLKLNVPKPIGNKKISQILSEGEQRAIAIAAFLAEVNLEPHKSAIVLDDPVSSLDHIKRERIAKRLAEEANHRQVIVFTHDLAFAWSLREKAEQAGAKSATRYVYSAFAAKGKVSDALPFEGLDLGKRVIHLRDRAKEARDALQQGNAERYDEIVRSGYRKLRDSWELLVEDKLFGQVVKRFRVSVATLRLRSVEVLDTDVKAIYDGMTRCSTFVHEGPVDAKPALPPPDEFEHDIEQLSVLLTAINARQSPVTKRRAAVGIPAN